MADSGVFLTATAMGEGSTVEDHDPDTTGAKRSGDGPDGPRKLVKVDTGYSGARSTREEKGRSKGQTSKSAGRRRTSRNDEPAHTPSGRGPRLPKRQCALMIGFCGTGCSGMQLWVLTSFHLTAAHRTLDQPKRCQDNRGRSLRRYGQGWRHLLRQC